MKKIDWARKLTSRKLWVSIAGLVVAVVTMFGGQQDFADKLAGAIMCIGAVVGYTVGEGLADMGNARGDNDDE